MLVWNNFAYRTTNKLVFHIKPNTHLLQRELDQILEDNAT